MWVVNTEISDAKTWHARAKSNLGLAKCGKINNDILYEDLCNQCSQAAEKALKALLVLKFGEQGYIPPKGTRGHDFKFLIKELEDRNITIPENIKIAAISQYPYGGFKFPFKFPFRLGSTTSLKDNAVNTRYPGNYQPIDEKGYRNALEKAELIVSWVEQQFNQTEKMHIENDGTGK